MRSTALAAAGIALLVIIGVVSVLTAGAILGIGERRPSIDDVPDGLADLAIETVRTRDAVALKLPDRLGDGTQVSICPGILPGPSDAAGIRERVRVSGCVTAARVPDPGGATWTVAFETLDPDHVVAFDAAERWLVVVIDPGRPPDDAARTAGAWIAGGPLLPTGPNLP